MKLNNLSLVAIVFTLIQARSTVSQDLNTTTSGGLTVTSTSQNNETFTSASMSFSNHSTTSTKNIYSTEEPDTRNNSMETSNPEPASEEKYVFERWFCYNASVPDQRYLSQCCFTEITRYRQRWFNGGYPLTTIMERLERWGCPEFEEECRSPTWPFTDFTRLMYNRFCNKSRLEMDCIETVRRVVQKYKFIKPPPRMTEITERRWSVLIESLDSPKMHLNDLVKPCIQVAVFDRKEGGVGRYHEIVEPYAPFCGLQWTGYDYNTAMRRGVSPWTGMSTWCRGSIIICMVVMAFAGIVTIVANSTILAVFGMTPKLRNSQAIYKISLAIADLSVGIVVWPNMIVMQYLMFFNSRTMGKLVKHSDNSTNGYSDNSTNSSWVAYFPFGEKHLPHRFPGGNFGSIFPRPYVVFFGFFITLSLIVSIYTLMIATFDRFWAVFRPLRYNKHNAKKQAKIACTILWFVSVLLSVIPIAAKPIEYHVISANFITSEGSLPLVLLGTGLFLPLLVTWVVTIATFQTSKKHARKRQRIMSSKASDSSESLERRLAKTLSLMVGVFTLCILPATFCTIAGLMLPQTTWGLPRRLDTYAANVYTSSEYVAVIILASNSLWNCFIYSLRTRGFQEASSKIYKEALSKPPLSYISSGAMYIIHGARRVSMTSFNQMRKMSSVSTTDLRKKSMTSMGTGVTKVSSDTASSSTRPSVDIDSSSFVGLSSTNGYTATYIKSGGKPRKTSMGVELRVERMKQQKNNEEPDVTEDSTWASFDAGAAGTDKFFHSVMENVKEELEENPEETSQLSQTNDKTET